MSVSVCLSVCLSVCMFVCLSVRDHVFGTTRPVFTKCSVHVTYDLLWQRSDTSCTSGFMDDVIFAHKPRLLERRRPAEAQCTRSLGLGYKLCAVIPVVDERTHGTTFRALKVTFQVATRGQCLRSVTALLVFSFRIFDCEMIC